MIPEWYKILIYLRKREGYMEIVSEIGFACRQQVKKEMKELVQS
jgi:hypothetical protein